MQGLEISRLYYESFGRDMIHSLFADYESKIAVGMVGQGSDCFGFDDETSRDHDFGAGFCMWVSDETYEKIGFRLTRAYQSLPEEFEGIKKYNIRPYGTDKFGVIKIPEFFLPLTGSTGAPQSNKQWLFTPDYALAAAVNGEVFRDDEGAFTAIREQIENMPEDVKLKKMSARVFAMAQSGQYNFIRCLKHGEPGAAALAKNEFVKNAVELCYTLKGQYSPFYKWSFRGMRSLGEFGFLRQALESLAVGETDESQFDEIERLSGIFASYLRKNGYSHSFDNFLEPHAYEIQSKIKDPTIAGLHITEG